VGTGIGGRKCTAIGRAIARAFPTRFPTALEVLQQLALVLRRVFIRVVALIDLRTRFKPEILLRAAQAPRGLLQAGFARVPDMHRL